MLQFNYEARDRSGQFVKGVIGAVSESAAVDALHGKDLVVLSLVPVEKSLFGSDISGFFLKPNQKDITVFTRQLATIIAADIPLIEGDRKSTRLNSSHMSITNA